jgi:hypothetical protein
MQEDVKACAYPREKHEFREVEDLDASLACCRYSFFVYCHGEALTLVLMQER